MKFEGSYSLERSGAAPEKGEAALSLLEDALVLAPARGTPLTLPWESLLSFSPSDHKVSLALSGASLVISGLGYKYDDFLRRASRLRNERLIKLDLAGEPMKHSMMEADLAFSAPGREFAGRCELRIHETSLLALPGTAEYLRLPFRYIAEVKEADYAVEIRSASGETWRLSGLGGKYDHFRDSLAAAMGATTFFVQEALRGAMPGADPLKIRALSGLLKEGLLVAAEEIERTAPGAFALIEKRIRSSKTDAAEYGFLKGLSAPGRTAFGVKKGLMGSLSGDHFIFVFGVEKPAPAAVVEYFLLEPAGEKTDKAATYVYRLPEGAGWPDFLDLFNRAMTAVNFRRMPVLLSDEALLAPENAAYAAAPARVPALRELRALYAGRAVHSEGGGWEADVKAILDFAASSRAPARWRKGGAAGPEEEEGEE